ncbi:MAG: cob(I)yrinic acid a,c-diamide adenosyltransferase [Ruminococcus flavefaciens]|nr:cob(I)yrinic acid a,c-diamide adenosyltransferase [Ruminococcus flavefaciens]
MIHIYTGDGKGKTTSAMGLAVRGAGAEMSVVVFQFMKDGSSSEIAVLEKLGIPVTCCKECSKFTFQMNADEISAVIDSHNMILEKIKSESADMIILDEFFGAYNDNLFDRKLAEQVVFGKSATEIILTGRNAPSLFTDKADYITVMTKVKHPYDKGIIARQGIEY